ncbi:MAG: (E)-4-hydroxy-3-methylbut-2-enyl-diphosphate synthase [Bdellovibrionales bacterium]|nr:(E)-4-hydroxy-3-methylbut-2-enyl-diphosphate synthase [Bdellovibrionales bacterium]
MGNLTLVPESRPERALPRRRVRAVAVGSTTIGGDAPIAIQSMCATKTTNIEATLAQIGLLERAGADLIRIAVDSRKDIEALEEIRKETAANLVIDLQENYRLAASAAPFVQKFRYNPGHLHHHQRETPVADKVKYLVDLAGAHDCAIRVGVNFGSLDPAVREQSEDPREAALASAGFHVELLEKLGFQRYVVSLKSSDPRAVVAINREFALRYPDVPLHLGVTEAGLLPDGAIKTRIAFEQLLAQGIGETVRVSLTLPDSEKDKEIFTAREIIEDVAAGRFRSVPDFLSSGLNVISCPSCSRVENGAFVRLAQEVKAALQYAREHSLTVAVMGCRVNGPGETDEADLGLWCAPTFVNLKRGETLLGKFAYDEVIPRLLQEVEAIIAERGAAQ